VRHTELTSAGWRTLRFTWEQVMFRPEWVLECVRDVIALVAVADRAPIAEQPAVAHRSHAA